MVSNSKTESAANTKHHLHVKVESTLLAHPLASRILLPCASSATALTIAKLTTHYSHAPVLIYFVLACALSAWLLDTLAGLLTLAIGFAAAIYFLIAPINSFQVAAEGDFIRLFVQAATAALVIFLISRLKSEQDRVIQLGTQFRATFEQAAVGMVHVDLDRRRIRVNDRYCQIVGYDRDELLGKLSQDITHPEDVAVGAVESRRMIRGDTKSLSLEKRYLRKDGSAVWANVTLSLVRDQSEKPAYFIVVVEDITERKRAEEALHESKERLETLIKDAPASLVMLDRNMRHVRVSNRWLRDVGLGDRDIDIVGKGHYEVFPDLPEHWKQAHRRGLAGETVNGEDEWVAADGLRRTVRWRINPWGDSGAESGGIIIFSEDITERKKAEDEIAEKARLLDLSYDAVFVRNSQNRITYWNQGAVRVYGFTLDEVLDRDPHELLQTQFSEPLDRILESLYREGRWMGELIHTRKDGRRITVASRWSLDRYANGNPAAILEIASDITDWKRADEALRRSETRLRRFYESGVVGVIYWNTEGAITEANDKFLDLVGYTRADMAEGCLNWARMTPPEFRELDDAALRGLKATGIGTAYEKEFVRKDGTRIPVVINSAMLDEARQKGVAFVLDITERKRAERALIRSEKLASVGRMAATVAHEINNPLEVVMNSLFLVSLDEQLSQQSRANLQNAEQELQRVAHLTRQTLGFYRENVSPVQVDLATLVKEVVDLYAPKFRQRGVALEADYGSNLRVHAIAGEIRQVVSNIVANAIDASELGGRIRIRTSCFPVHWSHCVRFTVGDTGTGIDPEHLSHIFEPFFTTKQSVGTGLGLWVTKEIVSRHGGKIRVRSRKGSGSAFSVLLPEIAHHTTTGGNGEEHRLEAAHSDSG
jgi:PAS domain S-box-containing protein